MDSRGNWEAYPLKLTSTDEERLPDILSGIWGKSGDESVGMDLRERWVY